MKLIKYKISLIIPLIFIVIGLFLGYSIFKNDDSLPNQWTITDNSNINKPKFATTESLVNEIRAVNKIVPLELELSDEIVINDSWGDLDILKKIKKINFYANCSYYIDLSTLSSESIKNTSNSIELHVSKPEVLSINILSDKTVYNEPELGLLRFGDISLSSEEYGLIYNDVVKVFTNKMLSEELYSKALTESETSLKKLVSDLVGNEKTVKIVFD